MNPYLLLCQSIACKTWIHNGGCHEPTPFALEAAPGLVQLPVEDSRTYFFSCLGSKSFASQWPHFVHLFICVLYKLYIFAYFTYCMYISMNILHARIIFACLTCLTFDDFVQDSKFPRWDAYVHLSCTNGRLESKSAFGQMPISDLLPPKWWMVMVSHNSKLLLFIYAYAI